MEGSFVQSRVPGGLSLCLVLLFSPGFETLASAEDDTPPGWKEFVEPVMSTDGVGTIFFPGRVGGGGTVEVFDPAGVRLRLTNPRDPIEERVLPSGRYVIPPSGRWRVWVEDGDRISSFARLVTFPRHYPGKSPPNVLPLDPGGRVMLPDGVETPSNSKLSVLVAEPHPLFGPHEFLRIKSVEDVESGILMPARSVVASLWSLRGLSVELTDSPHVPWVDVFMPPIRRSQELDVDIADAEIVVRVLDAATRRPIPDARVAVKNEYFDSEDDGQDDPEWGDRSTERGRRMLARTYRADEEGRARLAPPRPGRLEIFPSAAGSHESRDAAQVLEIEDPPQDREVEVLLHPIGETMELTLALPDGSPASGAEVMLVDSLWRGTVLFHGQVDDAGAVEIPSEHSHGALLLKHPAAASAVIDWREWAAKDEARWQLAAAAEIALTLEVTDPTGEEPARGARVALLVDGRRISGMPLRWLFEGPVGTDSNGHWTASRLPRSGVRLLAWESSVDEEATAGALDNFARNVEYPWPSTVEVRVVR